MKTDIEIAQGTMLKPIDKIARDIGLDPACLEHYGRFKAKVDPLVVLSAERKKRGRLLLVTAINPTPAGEGKTTITIGLADALRAGGKNVIVAMREPSQGPVFGVKGGATGGGYAQVAPMEDINLHFTGDMHAIGAANNLLAAMIDNHIYHGNELGIDPRRVTWHRCVDVNDRQLRHVTDGLGGVLGGFPREDAYDITVATETMAILCLASDISDLKHRLASVIVGYSLTGEPVTAGMLKAEGAMATLLKDALKPNLVQTLEGTPAFVHGGPFANIAHGCNTVVATRTALALGDYVITEAGFGADLGAEKFFDIKCRMSGLVPDAALVVATVRALKHHGGAATDALGTEDLAALNQGLPNLLRHVENIRTVYGLPVAVAINRFPDDTERELALVRDACRERSIRVALSDVWAHGSAGGADLAALTLELLREPAEFRYCYELDKGIEEKIRLVATKVYHAADVLFSPEARRQIAEAEALGFGGMPVCIAKTQYSFSDNPALLGAPDGFTMAVRGIRISAGAGFVVALTGEIMTMPGMPKTPSAEKIDVDAYGVITGLY
ncbi:MAG: formate--tetrahydrofolate ligase [Clostridiales Family XIII bacterium]|jgi:formate--tetrahydrofolate ligase|nr:formate--tetrahydrofolate ligase [Clostridiales Family XIII bacterium]